MAAARGSRHPRALGPARTQPQIRVLLPLPRPAAQERGSSQHCRALWVGKGTYIAEFHFCEANCAPYIERIFPSVEHGGTAPPIQKKARERLQDMVDPAISELQRIIGRELA